VVALAALLWLQVAPGAAAEWPQWLGPERNGRSPETGLLKSWPADGPREVWRRPGGLGYSGMAVAGGRLFTIAGRGDGEEVVCLDAGTGAPLWRQRIDTIFRERMGGDGPRSTPVVAGDRLFVLSSRGKLYCLSSGDGSTIWKRDFVEEFDSQVQQFGYSSSPLVDGQNLLVDVGGHGDSALGAFGISDGQMVWTSQGDKTAYGSPIIIESGGVRQAVFFTAEGPVALAPATGGLLWRHPWITQYDINVATPVFVPPDGIFISSGYDHGAALLRLQPGGAGVDLVWEERVMKNQMATSILHEGHLYGFDDGMLKCIEAATGEMRWRVRGLGRGTLIYADGHLLILGEGGQLVLAAASPVAYRERARVQKMGPKCWTIPSLASGRLYLRDERHIVCLDLRGS